MWTNSIQTCVFSVALVEYLTSHSLISLSQTAQVLGSELKSHLTNFLHALIVQDEWKGQFELPAEDYLHGLISLVNELVNVAWTYPTTYLTCTVSTGRQRRHFGEL